MSADSDFEQYLKQNAKLVDAEIEKLLPRKISTAWLDETLGKPKFAYDAETITKAVSDPVWDFLDRGGKRWRPLLMLLCCEAVGGGKKRALPFVVLPELVHNGTLLIDDIEDNSDMRRGKPATHKIFGTDIAINTANLMYYLPLRILYKNSQHLDESKKAAIYGLYAREMTRLSFGQAMDIFWHQGKKSEVTEEQYLQMCLYKTGCLARFSAELGAMLGGATPEQQEKLGEFAAVLGVAFQIQDDILELTEKGFQKGKGIAGGDIHEGKRTLLVIKTLERAPARERQRLLEILNSHPTDEKIIAEAVGMIKKYGAVDYARETAKSIVETAWGEAAKVLPQSKAKELLHLFANYAIERKI